VPTLVVFSVKFMENIISTEYLVRLKSKTVSCHYTTISSIQKIWYWHCLKISIAARLGLWADRSLPSPGLFHSKPYKWTGVIESFVDNRFSTIIRLHSKYSSNAKTILYWRL